MEAESIREIADQLDESEGLALSKSKLYGAMIHKLKSPLTAIQGFAETLLQKWGALGDVDKFRKVSKILEYVQEANQMICMDLECILNDFVGWNADLNEVDLNFCVLAIVDDLACFYPNLQMDQVLLTSPRVNIDPKIMQIILQHLVENAVRYGVAGREIVVHFEELPTKIGVSIINYSEDDSEVQTSSLSRFEAFEPGAKGTGLGMYIVRQYAESMAGALTVQATAGNGGDRRTAVTLWLPKEGSDYALRSREVAVGTRSRRQNCDT